MADRLSGSRLAAVTTSLIALLFSTASVNAMPTRVLERQAAAVPSVSSVPFRMDASNQAAWWSPIDEFGGDVYIAYDGWGGAAASTGGSADTHTVWIARRTPNGEWTRDCLRFGFACAVFRDDPGHRQPSIAVDGDGYIHVFTALHKNHWVYYRSGRPRDVHTMVNRSAQLPDQGDVYTYPVLTRTGRGDDLRHRGCDDLRRRRACLLRQGEHAEERPGVRRHEATRRHLGGDGSAEGRSGRAVGSDPARNG